MSSPTALRDVEGKLTLRARIAHMRALTWDGDWLYVSSGYQVFRARMLASAGDLDWQFVGRFRPSWNRKLTVSNRLSARLFRDGFHALAVSSPGAVVAAVPGAIVSLDTSSREFRPTFTITRGTRPLHIASVPGKGIFWGEYFDNRSRDEVHIYRSSDGGASWDVAYTFAKGSIRHVHNIVHDPWLDCLWVLTGDYGDECRLLRASCDFGSIEVVLQGQQQARAVAAIPTEEALYFASDTPLEHNFIYRLDHAGKLTRLASTSSSCIQGCRVGSELFFSTMVEPSDVNRDPTVRVYGGSISDPNRWQPMLGWRKDRWSMRYLQYGNAFLPGGDNKTQILAVTTVAVEADDMVTSLYSVKP